MNCSCISEREQNVLVLALTSFVSSMEQGVRSPEGTDFIENKYLQPARLMFNQLIDMPVCKGEAGGV